MHKKGLFENQGDQPKMFVYASVPIKKGKTYLPLIA